MNIIFNYLNKLFMNNLDSNNEKPYIRPKLIELSKEEEKKPFNTEELENIFNEKFSFINFKTSNLKYLTYYYYNSESINDYNWGCAWRSTQTVLSYLLSIKGELSKKDISFKSLFMNYGSQSTLINIFKKDYNINSEKIPDYIDIPFSPFETDKGWAEPFISKLILFDFGFKSELFLINNYPVHAYAPKEVFQKTINFEEFVKVLEKHFNHKNPSPIIIDDSCISLIISGIKVEDNFVYLIILDPHIQLKRKGDTGIYYIKLLKDGSYDINENKQETIFGERLNFKEINWMILLPENISN